ncbi:MAG: hypothetical protein GX643_11870, partial [Acidimicrobiales bacterium]|nr:hypothetical protein [Acidimicrobiales bacterium]
HHDGELFAFIDPDILARGPYLAPLLDRLTSASAVTSGREVWSEHNTRPAGHLGVNGEYFFDQDGYVFGSPHFALYRRHDLEEVVDRWKVGFSTDGNVDPEVRARLEELGRSFLIYDTGKVVNILLQGDGHRLVHEESDQIVHVGGMSHYLAPPQPVRSPDGSYVKEWGQEDDWRKWDGMADRWDIAEYSARALQAVSIGKPPPEPHTVADHLTARATTVFDAFTELSLLLGLGDQPRDAP